MKMDHDFDPDKAAEHDIAKHYHSHKGWSPEVILIGGLLVLAWLPLLVRLFIAIFD